MVAALGGDVLELVRAVPLLVVVVSSGTGVADVFSATPPAAGSAVPALVTTLSAPPICWLAAASGVDCASAWPVLVAAGEPSKPAAEAPVVASFAVPVDDGAAWLTVAVAGWLDRDEAETDEELATDREAEEELATDDDKAIDSAADAEREPAPEALALALAAAELAAAESRLARREIEPDAERDSISEAVCESATLPATDREIDSALCCEPLDDELDDEFDDELDKALEDALIAADSLDPAADDLAELAKAELTKAELANCESAAELANCELTADEAAELARSEFDAIELASLWLAEAELAVADSSPDVSALVLMERDRSELNSCELANSDSEALAREALARDASCEISSESSLDWDAEREAEPSSSGMLFDRETENEIDTLAEIEDAKIDEVVAALAVVASVEAAVVWRETLVDADTDAESDASLDASCEDARAELDADPSSEATSDSKRDRARESEADAELGSGPELLAGSSERSRLSRLDAACDSAALAELLPDDACALDAEADSELDKEVTAELDAEASALAAELSCSLADTDDDSRATEVEAD